MDRQSFITSILNNQQLPPEFKQEAERFFQAMEKDRKRKDFMIEKLREDKKITENFLNKTVQELEEKNNELYQTARERKLANEQLIGINQELEQFAFVISHDLQEPLSTVINFVGLLERTKTELLDDKALMYLDFIAQSSNRMTQMIRAMLDYSRIGKTGSKSKIDCNVLLAEVLDDLSGIISAKQAIIKKIKMPYVFGYKNELRALFQNILTNALKYAREGVVPEIIINCRSIARCWEFSISDNGIGFNTRYNDKIFILFQRLNHPTQIEGSGIGLARCKKIVELHGGKIWADSKPQHGSTFYFTLPKIEKE